MVEPYAKVVQGIAFDLVNVSLRDPCFLCGNVDQSTVD